MGITPAIWHDQSTRDAEPSEGNAAINGFLRSESQTILSCPWNVRHIAGLSCAAHSREG